MASNIKFIEFTSEPWDRRWIVLTQVLKEKGINLSVEIKQSDKEHLKEGLNAILQSQNDLCRVGDRLIPFIFKHLINTTFDVSLSQSVGLLTRENEKWWPLPFVDEAFTRSVSAQIGQVDLNAAALVIGSGGASKLVVSSLVKMGFQTVNIADGDSPSGVKMAQALKSKYFDTKFEYIPTQDLTNLPGIHSLVVNTNPLDEKDDLYAELYFFNFLKPGGVVVDLTLVPSRSPLIIEAEKWGARYLEGDAIAAERDGLMVEKYMGLKLDLPSYRALLRAEIDAVPFDPSPYLKRFSDRAL